MRMAHRRMTALDMQAWTACRMIGEAASRTSSADPGEDHAGHEERRFRRRRLQGAEALAARLGLAAAPADPAVGRPHRRVDLAATRLPASGHGTGHARLRPTGDANANCNEAACGDRPVAGWLACRRPACCLHRLCVERARQHHQRRRPRPDEDGQDDPGRSAPARHHHDQGRQRDPGLRQRRRHHPDHRRRDAADRRRPAVGPGSGDLRPARLGQSALRVERRRQHGDRDRRADAQGDRADPDRRRTRGHGGQPGRPDHRQHVRNHQHGAFPRLQDAQDGGRRAGRCAAAHRHVQA